GIVPQNVGEDREVVLDRVRPPMEPRLRADDREALLVPPVGQVEALCPETPPDLCDGLEERSVQLDRGHRLAGIVDLVQGKPRLQVGSAGVRHHLEQVAVFRDVLHLVSKEEAVVQRGQRLFLRQLGGRPHERLEGTLQDLAVVVEEPLVDQGEEAVQDRTVRLPDLVQEREVSLGEVAASEAREPILFQGGYRDGAEQFVGKGEARHQSLEIFRAVDRAREHDDYQALLYALQTAEEQVLPRREPCVYKHKNSRVCRRSS